MRARPVLRVLNRPQNQPRRHFVKATDKIFETEVESLDNIKHEFPFTKPNKAREKDVCYSLNPPGGLRWYIFNRRHEGNAINSTMIRWFNERLIIANERQGTGDLFGVAIRNIEDSSCFSVGLNQKHLYDLKDDKQKLDVYQSFYQLCGQLSSMTKPVVMFMDGVIEDAGVGFALNAKLRVATDKSVLRIGQVARGFFPDGGLTHWLSKLDNGLGMYLALTADKLYGRDLVHAQLANYYIFGDSWKTLINVSGVNVGHPDTLDLDLEGLCEMWQLQDRYESPFTLESYMGAIERCFMHDSVDGIIHALENEKEEPEWARTTLVKIRKNSPFSVKVTHEALKRGAGRSIENCLKMEYILAQRFLSTPDYNEGLQAALQNRTPRWKHESTLGVTQEDVEMMFRVVGDTKELELPYYEYSPHFHPGKDHVPLSPEWRDTKHHPYDAKTAPEPKNYTPPPVPEDPSRYVRATEV